MLVTDTDITYELSSYELSLIQTNLSTIPSRMSQKSKDLFTVCHIYVCLFGLVNKMNL